MNKSTPAFAVQQHRKYRGKIQSALKCPIRSDQDMAVWYTPGVAAPCREIAARSDAVFELTNKGNTVAIVSDGTRILGLGDIGPEAGLPVMEGKALLFKYLGGVDAVPVCLKTTEPDEIVRTVQILEPSFGAINLEDISQPKCFGILDRLRDSMNIPVWHDDQQGTATVLLAGLTNATHVVGKTLNEMRILLVGAGAANVAAYRLFCSYGIDPGTIVACDSRGILHRQRADIEQQQTDYAEKWRICQESNSEDLRGGIEDAIRGADVCIALSAPGPGIIRPEWIRRMANQPIVFACANPMPEIMPSDALDAGAAIVATGRSDFPNQVNNSLAFPSIFRGVLDVRATRISDTMAIAAATELAAVAQETGLRPDRILPSMRDTNAYVRVAVATAMQAQTEGLAREQISRDDEFAHAERMIRDAQRMSALITQDLDR